MIGRRGGRRRKGRRRARGRAPSQPVTQSLGPSRRNSRQVQRQRRQKKRRIRASGGVVATGAVIVALLLFFIGRTVIKSDDGGPEPRSQRTLLLEVKAADGAARAAALLAHDPADGKASILLVPTRVIVDVPGVGSQVFAQALKLGGTSASRGALADLLGVTVDADWTLDSDAFAKLIDNLGGVTIDVDVDVTRPLPSGGATIELPRGGGQRVNGTQALRFATYVAQGEDGVAALPRLQEVLEQMMQELTDVPRLTSAITALGRGSSSALPAARLAELVTAIAASRRADAIAYEALPVVPIETGSRTVTYRVDLVQVEELVQRSLAASVPLNRFAGENRVILLNGVGTPGITATAQQRLSREGFRVERTGNANNFAYKTSVVLIKDAGQSAQDLGRKVASTLRLPANTIQIFPREITVADIVVIIGRDYRP